MKLQMKPKNLFFFVFAVLMYTQSQSQDLTESSFGDGIINVVAKDSSFSAKVGIRFQPLFSSSWILPERGELDNNQSNFLIRRARLKFDGFVYSPRLVYKVELGLSNRDISGANEFTNGAPRYLLDAVAKWNFYGNFELWAGQAKLPGNRERVISSGNLETVDRSLVNSRFNIDRDLGFQLHHHFNPGKQFVIREIISISQGEGRNIVAGNLGGYQYTGRIELLPFGKFDDYTGADLDRESSLKMALGISYDYNNNAVRTRSNSGTYMVTNGGMFQTDISTFFADFILKYRGLSILSEYAKRSADRPVAVEADGTPTGDYVNVGEGFNFQVGYLLKNDFQILARFTEVNEELNLSYIKNQYSLGLSKYIVGHKLKVQTDVSYNSTLGQVDDGLMYRFQFEVHL